MRFVPKVPSTGSPTLNTISGLGLKDHGSIPIDVNAGDKACVQTTPRGTSQRALKLCIALPAALLSKAENDRKDSKLM